MGTDVFVLAEVAVKDDIINLPKYKLIDNALADIMQFSKYKLSSTNSNANRVENQQIANSPTLSKLLLSQISEHHENSTGLESSKSEQMSHSDNLTIALCDFG